MGESYCMQILKTSEPTVCVALVPGTQDWPRHLVCHVTGFYPCDIELTWELSLCSITLAGVHHLSYLQLISPDAAPGLPKRLHVERVNGLVLSACVSNTGRLDP
ncbi:unnamed protein product [Caretta caretta]